MLNAVFFDAAGTLFNSREPVGEIYARIAREHGVDAEAPLVNAGFRRAFAAAPGLAFGTGHAPAEILRLEHQWWYRLVRKCFEGMGEFDDFDRFFSDLFTYFAEPAHWVVDPSAPSLLQQLKESKVRLGVISNFDSRLYRILEGLELRAYFDSVTISSEAGYAKPAREIFQAALANTGATAPASVHVGDSEHMDLRGAQEAGFGAILIDAGMNGPQQIHGRTARVSSLAYVAKVVQLLRFA